MTRPVLDVVVLFPDVLNAHADARNAQVLIERAGWEGVDVRVRDIRSDEGVTDAPADVWLVGDGLEPSLDTALAAARRAAAILRAAADRGEPFLCVGMGLHILGEAVETTPDRWEGAAGVFTGTAGLLPRHASSELVAETPWGSVVGYENHSRGYRPGVGEEPWGSVVTGIGNGDGTEGVWSRSLLGTHAHGPVLAFNPALADHVLDRALRRRHGLGFSAESADARRVDSLVERARSGMLAHAGSTRKPPARRK